MTSVDVVLYDLAAAVWGWGAEQTLLGASVNVDGQCLLVQRHLQRAVFYVPVVFSG